MMPRLPLPFLAVLAFQTFLARGAGAGMIRVPLDAPGPQAAIDAASAGDLILVAAGEYVLAAPLSFLGKEVTVRAEMGAVSTVLRLAGPPLDPDRASVVVFDSGEGPGAVLDGFTITGGSGSRWGAGSTQSGGGGILVRRGSRPTVLACVVAGNSARNGGGLLVDEGSAIVLSATVLWRNRSSGFGGGALFIGSAAETLVEDCQFALNAAGSGAGLFFYDDALGRVERCRIEANSADSVGGGMCCLLGGAPQLARCVFLGNLAFAAGAVSCETSRDNPSLTNCLIVGNYANFGGAVLARGGAAPALIQTTVASNATAGLEGGVACEGGAPLVIGSIVRDNFPESICGEPSASLTEGAARFRRLAELNFESFVEVDLAGETRLLPSFVLDAGDYRLEPDSAAVDAGTTASSPAEDLDGRPRPCGAGAEMGAYELCGIAFRRGDANADGRFDLSDGVFVLLYLFSGGERPPCLESADTDGSSRLDITDGVYVLNYLFLGTPPPPAPFPGCGAAAAPSPLSCEAFPPCAG